MLVFRTPACQGAFDSVCCSLATACANDRACGGLAQCANDCKVSTSGRARDNCTDGCAVRMRVAFCEGKCQGRGDGCTATCTRDGAPGDPIERWLQVTSCSKGVRYPEGVTCNDKT